jgi:hypothetical protein
MSSALASLRSKSAIRWATEEPSNESVRTKLEQHGVDANEQVPLGDGLSASGRQMQEWLAEKDESHSRWVKVGVIAAVSAAVFAFLAWGFPLLPPQAAPDAPSPDLQQLKAMSTDLVAVRQSVDRLAAQFVAGQEQMTRDITKLQGILENIVKLHATEQNIFDSRISAPPPRPAAASARQPAPLTPLPLTPAPLTPPPAVR